MERPVEAKVCVLKPFYVGNDVQEKGKIVTLPIRLANEVVTSNKAEFVYEAYQPPKKEVLPEPKIAETESKPRTEKTK